MAVGLGAGYGNGLFKYASAGNTTCGGSGGAAGGWGASTVFCFSTSSMSFKIPRASAVTTSVRAIVSVSTYGERESVVRYAI